VLVRATDRRAAAERRLAGCGVRIVDGAPVRAVDDDAGTTTVRSGLGDVRATAVLDASGPRCPEAPGPGRVLLHQRFVGRWVTTTRPVFDSTTVTLMDFDGAARPDAVHFVYVLPVSPTEALVESTLFTADPGDPTDHRAEVTAHLRRRWGLRDHEWQVVDEEQGCIPMTDVPPTEWPAGVRGPASTSAVTGTTRPSSGYGFARSNRHAAVVAACLAAGTDVPAFRDRARTRFLDAVFLRFLRDRPEQAPEAFRRLFALPGPTVVRFLTDRSSLTDDLRIVLALPKRPFLGALGRTAVDALHRSHVGRRAARTARP
jgi:lycopene beta-cyclase